MGKRAKAVFIAALLLMVIPAAGCFNSGVGKDGGSYIDDDYLAALDGSETEVTVLSSSAHSIGAGYADQIIPSYAAKLTQERAEKGYNEISQYFVTKEAYNYNADNNHIRLRYVDWGWDEPLVQKMTAAIMAWNSGIRSAPDVVIGETQLKSYALQGHLQRFPDELEQWIRENMLSSSYKFMELSAAESPDGKAGIFGVAYDAAPQILIWDKSVLRDCGISEAVTENGVETWQEWLNVCKAVGSKKGYIAGGIYAGDNTGGAIRTYPFIQMAGGTLQNSDGSPNLNNAGATAALEFVREQSKTNLTENYLGAQSEQEYYSYFGKKMGYATAGSYQLGVWSDAGRDLANLGRCRLPVYASGDKGTTTLIASTYLAVPSWTDKAGDAFKVIKSYCSEQVQTVLGRRAFKPVNNVKVGEADWYKTNLQYFAYQIMKNDNIAYLPAFLSNGTSIWTEFNRALVKAALHKSYPNTVKSYLDQAQTEASKYFGG